MEDSIETLVRSREDTLSPLRKKMKSYTSPKRSVIHHNERHTTFSASSKPESVAASDRSFDADASGPDPLSLSQNKLNFRLKQKGKGKTSGKEGDNGTALNENGPPAKQSRNSLPVRASNQGPKVKPQLSSQLNGATSIGLNSKMPVGLPGVSPSVGRSSMQVFSPRVFSPRTTGSPRAVTTFVTGVGSPRQTFAMGSPRTTFPLSKPHMNPLVKQEIPLLLVRNGEYQEVIQKHMPVRDPSPPGRNSRDPSPVGASAPCASQPVMSRGASQLNVGVMPVGTVGADNQQITDSNLQKIATFGPIQNEPQANDMVNPDPDTNIFGEKTASGPNSSGQSDPNSARQNLDSARTPIGTNPNTPGRGQFHFNNPGLQPNTPSRTMQPNTPGRAKTGQLNTPGRATTGAMTTIGNLMNTPGRGSLPAQIGGMGSARGTLPSSPWRMGSQMGGQLPPTQYYTGDFPNQKFIQPAGPLAQPIRVGPPLAVQNQIVPDPKTGVVSAASTARGSVVVVHNNPAKEETDHLPTVADRLPTPERIRDLIPQSINAQEMMVSRLNGSENVVDPAVRKTADISGPPPKTTRTGEGKPAPNPPPTLPIASRVKGYSPRNGVVGVSPRSDYGSVPNERTPIKKEHQNVDTSTYGTVPNERTPLKTVLENKIQPPPTTENVRPEDESPIRAQRQRQKQQMQSGQPNMQQQQQVQNMQQQQPMQTQMQTQMHNVPENIQSNMQQQRPPPMQNMQQTSPPIQNGQPPPAMLNGHEQQQYLQEQQENMPQVPLAVLNAQQQQQLAMQNQQRPIMQAQQTLMQTHHTQMQPEQTQMPSQQTQMAQRSQMQESYQTQMQMPSAQLQQHPEDMQEQNMRQSAPTNQQPPRGPNQQLPPPLPTSQNQRQDNNQEFAANLKKVAEQSALKKADERQVAMKAGTTQDDARLRSSSPVTLPTNANSTGYLYTRQLPNAQLPNIVETFRQWGTEEQQKQPPPSVLERYVEVADPPGKRRVSRSNREMGIGNAKEKQKIVEQLKYPITNNHPGNKEPPAGTCDSKLENTVGTVGSATGSQPERVEGVAVIVHLRAGGKDVSNTTMSMGEDLTVSPVAHEKLPTMASRTPASPETQFRQEQEIHRQMAKNMRHLNSELPPVKPSPRVSKPGSRTGSPRRTMTPGRDQPSVQRDISPRLVRDSAATPAFPSPPGPNTLVQNGSVMSPGGRGCRVNHGITPRMDTSGLGFGLTPRSIQMPNLQVFVDTVTNYSSNKRLSSGLVPGGVAGGHYEVTSTAMQSGKEKKDQAPMQQEATQQQHDVQNSNDETAMQHFKTGDPVRYGRADRRRDTEQHPEMPPELRQSAAMAELGDDDFGGRRMSGVAGGARMSGFDDGVNANNLNDEDYLLTPVKNLIANQEIIHAVVEQNIQSIENEVKETLDTARRKEEEAKQVGESRKGGANSEIDQLIEIYRGADGPLRAELASAVREEYYKGNRKIGEIFPELIFDDGVYDMHRGTGAFGDTLQADTDPVKEEEKFNTFENELKNRLKSASKGDGAVTALLNEKPNLVTESMNLRKSNSMRNLRRKSTADLDGLPAAPEKAKNWEEQLHQDIKEKERKNREEAHKEAAKRQDELVVDDQPEDSFVVPLPAGYLEKFDHSTSLMGSVDPLMVTQMDPILQGQSGMLPPMAHPQMDPPLPDGTVPVMVPFSTGTMVYEDPNSPQRNRGVSPMNYRGSPQNRGISPMNQGISPGNRATSPYQSQVPFPALEEMPGTTGVIVGPPGATPGPPGTIPQTQPGFMPQAQPGGFMPPANPFYGPGTQMNQQGFMPSARGIAPTYQAPPSYAGALPYDPKFDSPVMDNYGMPVLNKPHNTPPPVWTGTKLSMEEEKPYVEAQTPAYIANGGNPYLTDQTIKMAMNNGNNGGVRKGSGMHNAGVPPHNTYQPVGSTKFDYIEQQLRELKAGSKESRSKESHASPPMRFSSPEGKSPERASPQRDRSPERYKNLERFANSQRQSGGLQYGAPPGGQEYVSSQQQKQHLRGTDPYLPNSANRTPLKEVEVENDVPPRHQSVFGDKRSLTDYQKSPTQNPPTSTSQQPLAPTSKQPMTPTIQRGLEPATQQAGLLLTNHPPVVPTTQPGLMVSTQVSQPLVESKDNLNEFGNENMLFQMFDSITQMLTPTAKKSSPNLTEELDKATRESEQKIANESGKNGETGQAHGSGVTQFLNQYQTPYHTAEPNPNVQNGQSAFFNASPSAFFSVVPSNAQHDPETTNDDSYKPMFHIAPGTFQRSRRPTGPPPGKESPLQTDAIAQSRTPGGMGLVATPLESNRGDEQRQSNQNHPETLLPKADDSIPGIADPRFGFQQDQKIETTVSSGDSSINTNGGKRAGDIDSGFRKFFIESDLDKSIADDVDTEPDLQANDSTIDQTFQDLLDNTRPEEKTQFGVHVNKQIGVNTISGASLLHQQSGRDPSAGSSRMPPPMQATSKTVMDLRSPVDLQSNDFSVGDMESSSSFIPESKNHSKNSTQSTMNLLVASKETSTIGEAGIVSGEMVSGDGSVTKVDGGLTTVSEAQSGEYNSTATSPAIHSSATLQNSSPRPEAPHANTVLIKQAEQSNNYDFDSSSAEENEESRVSKRYKENLANLGENKGGHQASTSPRLLGGATLSPRSGTHSARGRRGSSSLLAIQEVSASREASEKDGNSDSDENKVGNFSEKKRSCRHTKEILQTAQEKITTKEENTPLVPKGASFQTTTAGTTIQNDGRTSAHPNAAVSNSEYSYFPVKPGVRVGNCYFPKQATGLPVQEPDVVPPVSPIEALDDSWHRSGTPTSNLVNPGGPISSSTGAPISSAGAPLSHRSNAEISESGVSCQVPDTEWDSDEQEQRFEQDVDAQGYSEINLSMRGTKNRTPQKSPRQHEKISPRQQLQDRQQQLLKENQLRETPRDETPRDFTTPRDPSYTPRTPRDPRIEVIPEVASSMENSGPNALEDSGKSAVTLKDCIPTAESLNRFNSQKNLQKRSVNRSLNPSHPLNSHHRDKEHLSVGRGSATLHSRKISPRPRSDAQSSARGSGWGSAINSARSSIKGDDVADERVSTNRRDVLTGGSWSSSTDAITSSLGYLSSLKEKYLTPGTDPNSTLDDKYSDLPVLANKVFPESPQRKTSTGQIVKKDTGVIGVSTIQNSSADVEAMVNDLRIGDGVEWGISGGGNPVSNNSTGTGVGNDTRRLDSNNSSNTSSNNRQRHSPSNAARISEKAAKKTSMISMYYNHADTSGSDEGESHPGSQPESVQFRGADVHSNSPNRVSKLDSNSPCGRLTKLESNSSGGMLSKFRGADVQSSRSPDGARLSSPLGKISSPSFGRSPDFAGRSHPVSPLVSPKMLEKPSDGKPSFLDSTGFGLYISSSAGAAYGISLLTPPNPANPIAKQPFLLTPRENDPSLVQCNMTLNANGVSDSLTSLSDPPVNEDVSSPLQDQSRVENDRMMETTETNSYEFQVGGVNNQFTVRTRTEDVIINDGASESGAIRDSPANSASSLKLRSITHRFDDRSNHTENVGSTHRTKNTDMSNAGMSLGYEYDGGSSSAVYDDIYNSLMNPVSPTDYSAAPTVPATARSLGESNDVGDNANSPTGTRPVFFYPSPAETEEKFYLDSDCECAEMNEANMPIGESEFGERNEERADSRRNLQGGGGGVATDEHDGDRLHPEDQLFSVPGNDDMKRAKENTTERKFDRKSRKEQKSRSPEGKKSKSGERKSKCQEKKSKPDNKSKLENQQDDRCDSKQSSSSSSIHDILGPAKEMARKKKEKRKAAGNERRDESRGSESRDKNGRKKKKKSRRVNEDDVANEANQVDEFIEFENTGGGVVDIKDELGTDARPDELGMDDDLAQDIEAAEPVVDIEDELEIDGHHDQPGMDEHPHDTHAEKEFPSIVEDDVKDRDLEREKRKSRKQRRKSTDGDEKKEKRREKRDKPVAEESRIDLDENDERRARSSKRDKKERKSKSRKSENMSEETTKEVNANAEPVWAIDGLLGYFLGDKSCDKKDSEEKESKKDTGVVDQPVAEQPVIELPASIQTKAPVFAIQEEEDVPVEEAPIEVGFNDMEASQNDPVNATAPVDGLVGENRKIVDDFANQNNDASQTNATNDANDLTDKTKKRKSRRRTSTPSRKPHKNLEDIDHWHEVWSYFGLGSAAAKPEKFDRKSKKKKEKKDKGEAADTEVVEADVDQGVDADQNVGELTAGDIQATVE